MSDRCQGSVTEKTGRGLHKGFSTCGAKAWKDGYCKTHHPERIKEREDKKYHEWVKKQPSYKWKMKMKNVLDLLEDGKIEEAKTYIKEEIR